MVEIIKVPIRLNYIGLTELPLVRNWAIFLDFMTELEKIIDDSTLLQAQKEHDKKLLQTQQINTLSDWQKAHVNLSETQKTIYPHGLQILLNEACGVHMNTLINSLDPTKDIRKDDNYVLAFGGILSHLYGFMDYVYRTHQSDNNKSRSEERYDSKYDLVPSWDIDNECTSSSRVSSDVGTNQTHSLKKRSKK